MEFTKKIVHIVWSFKYGGIETMLVNIANAQVEEGAEVHVVIMHDIFDAELIEKFSSKIVIHKLHRVTGSYNPLFILRLNFLLLRINPNAIHLHSSGFFKTLLLKKFTKISCCTLHDMPHGTIRGKKILSKLLPIIDFTLRSNVTFINEIPHVYSISQSVADALLQEYGIQSKVVPNGICAQNFSLRKHTGVHTPVRAIQVSRLMHEKKGQDLLIRAVKKLEGELSVDFIGTGNSMTYLQTLSEELGVTHLVRFLGLKPQSYIAEHLKDYDIFVQPSRYEGFGLTVAEALAANLPTLVSSGQGPEEIICGFHYGWVFQNGDLDDLTEKLKFIVSHYDKAEQKASTAHEYVKNTYDVSVTAKTYLKEYNNF